jgi:hypothetical protein
VPKGKTGDYVKTFIIKLASALVALSMVLGAGAAQAANQTLADAELKAAYAASNIQAMKDGFVMVPPSLQTITYKYVYSPTSQLVPSNIAISMSLGQVSATTILNVHDYNPLNPLGSSDSNVTTDVLEDWFELVHPDEAGFALGVENAEEWTLEAYEVTRPVAGQIAVHLDKRSGVWVDQNSNPVVREIDAIFTLDAGLIVAVEVTSNDPNNVGDGRTTLNYDPEFVADAFAAAVLNWKQMRFDSTSLTLAMRITKAFQSSETAALKTGVTIKSLGKDLAGLGLYNSALKKSVIVRQAAPKSGSKVNAPASSIAFSGVEETFGDIWAYVFSFDEFKKGSIKYSSKTSTYTLKGVMGSVATIKLNSQGRVAAVSTSGIFDTSYTFSYSADKALWAKWGNFGPKTQALMAWIVDVDKVVWGSKLVFTKTETGVKATGAKGYSSEFNTSGISASTVSAVFKQLGYVLK